MTSEQRAKLERQRSVRGGHRGVATKLIKETTKLLSATSDMTPLSTEGKTRLDVIHKQLCLKSEVLNGLNAEILELCEVSDIEGEIEEAEVITARIIECQAKIEKFVKSSAVPSSASPTSGILSVDPREMPRGNTTHARTRLPKLVLPKFKGDVTTWTAFWDSYKSAVHDNTEISAVDKFNYLKSLLEGPAARCVEGLSVTEGNYADAVELLQHRFGRTQQVITAHMDELLKIAACTNDKPSSLRFVFDKINVHVRGLSSLGVTSEQYGSLLIPIIMSKLPSDIRLRIARETTEEVWKIEDLIGVIRTEVEAREASESIKVNPTRYPLTVPRPSSNPSSTASSLFSSEGKVQCVYCGKDHYSASCDKITSTKERKDMLLKSGRCFTCLRTNHKSRDCSSSRNCRLCHRRHHQSICESRPESSSPNAEPSSVTNTANSIKGKGTILLQTAQAIATNNTSHISKSVRVLFDNGSQRSYITERLQSQLKLRPIRNEKLLLNTFGGNKFKSQNRNVYKLSLQRPRSHEAIEIVVVSFPVICSSLPTPVNLTQFPHLKDLELADSPDNPPGPIDILIGSDFYWTLVGEEIIRGAKGPIAVNSKLGWLVSGPVCGIPQSVNTFSNLIMAETLDDTNGCDQLTDLLHRFWQTEAIGIQEDCATEPMISEDFLKDIKYEENHYEVPLPWKRDCSDLSNHYNLSYNHLKYLQRRLLRYSKILGEYNDIIQQQLHKGIIEKVYPTNADELNARDEGSHYLPHHAVVREERETTKVRIVYDGSARIDNQDYSINDCLHTGPNFIPKLFDILIRFRSHPIALVADIEKAFLMIGIAKEDRDKLRFLWFENPFKVDSEVIHFRFTRLMFGLRPSPAILGAVITHHLSKYKHNDQEVINMICDSLYVDMVSGATDIEQAFNIYLTSKKVMSEGGFNLRKWISNSKELMRRIHDTESSNKETLNSSTGHNVTEGEESCPKSLVKNFNHNGELPSKLLGVSWNNHSDEFVFDFTELIKHGRQLPPSKRSLLKFTAKIFDPLGLLSPFIIRLKVLFQSLCVGQGNWDDPLQGELLNQWRSILSELESIKSISIPRCYFFANSSPSDIQIHGFCDASSQAYAAVLYIRSVYSDGHIDVRIVASKTRVAPLKKPTIPRLELLGAVILSRLVNAVTSSLLVKHRITYWVDSTAVLYWIKNDRPWKQYVNSRLQEIHSLTCKQHWRHCPGRLNPADLPTRGLKGEELAVNDLWWSGPQFLKAPESKWPSNSNYETDEVATLELRKQQTDLCHTMLVSTEDQSKVSLDKLIDCTRFSSYLSLLKTTAFVVRFIRACQGHNCQKYLNKEPILSATELNNAETHWIKCIQDQSFIEEIECLTAHKHRNSIRIIQLGLFLDNGILRCYGRINNSNLPISAKHPVLLPTKHPYVTLLIRHFHQQVKHNGVNDTLTALREKYWILRGRQAVKSVIRSCTTCLRWEGVSYSYSNSPDLPKDRVSEDPPFAHTGIDFAGPMYVRYLLSNEVIELKTYICLFTCASTRGIHLELTTSLSVDQFLLAFRRFTSRRGMPNTLWSDNAKTFKSSARELQRILCSSKVHGYLANKQVNWRFIIDRAPWWGGFWERMVKSVKRCLRKSIGRTTLTLDELSTLLTEVESVINARPLTYVYDDAEGCTYTLCPFHLLCGRRISSTPSEFHNEVVSTQEALTRKAKHHRTLLRHFNTRWKRDYLLSLREFHSIKRKVRPGQSIEIGDVVVLRNDCTKRTFWKLAVVKSLIEGSDGVVRAAVVRVASQDGTPRILKRSVKHLYPIEVKANFENTQPMLPTSQDSEVSKEDEGVKGIDNSSRPRRAAALTGEMLRRIRQTEH